MKTRNILKYLLFCCFANSPSIAQTTGVYPYGSFDRPGIDTINAADLNIYLLIPIVSKPGRAGDDFTYNLSYNSNFWTKAYYMDGSQQWQPNAFGWNRDAPTGIFGHLDYQQYSQYCEDPNDPQQGSYTTVYTNFVYYDEKGDSHMYAGSLGGCPSDTQETPSPAADGSRVVDTTHVALADGRTVLVNYFPVQVSESYDRNGNRISYSNGSFTDTTGSVALTVTDGNYSFPVPGGTSHVQTAYQEYTIQTNFVCTGVLDYGPVQRTLISSLQLPNGSSYQFTYEATPGIPGAFTGRLASITLPTGGTISYTYSGNGDGCSNGMNANGHALVLSRSSDSGTTTYDTTYASLQTKITRPNADYELRTYAQGPTTYFETNRKLFTSSSSTPILDFSTNYCSGGDTSSNCGAAFFQTLDLGLAPGLIQTFQSIDGSGLRGEDTVMNSMSAQASQVVHYDYGDATHRGAALYSENYTYQPFGDWRDFSQFYQISSAIDRTPTQTAIDETDYHYDEWPIVTTSGVPQRAQLTGNARGFLSSITQKGGSSPDLTTKYIHYDTGIVQSSIQVASGFQWPTSYTYEGTNTYVTGSSLPTPASGVALSTSTTVDVASSLPTSATGVNGTTTSIVSYDASGRPTEVHNPDGGWTKYTYPDVHESDVTTLIQAGSAGAPDTVAVTKTHYDDYGRVTRIAQWVSGNDWNQVDYCYTYGRTSFVSMPYRGGGLSSPFSNTCTGAGTAYTYDALGRVTNIITPDGTQSIVHSGADTQITDVNNLIKLQRMDGLGRLTRVCEVVGSMFVPPSGTEAPVPCGMLVAGNGYVTTYSYDMAAHLTTVQQGAQTRKFQTDALGQTILTVEPERSPSLASPSPIQMGATQYQYSYNATGLVTTRTRGRANQLDPTVTTQTVSQYDSLGRLVSTSYSNGEPTKHLYYDQAVDAYSGVLLYNKGQLSLLNDDSGYTAAEYKYDSMGRVVQMDECLPGYCSDSSRNIFKWYTYDLAGDLVKEEYPVGSYGPNATRGSNTYTFNNGGDVLGIANSQVGSVVSDVETSPVGPKSYLHRSNDYMTSLYDSMGRETGRWNCQGSRIAPDCHGGSPGYAWIASYKGSRVLSTADGYLGMYQDPHYDDLGRMTGLVSTYGDHSTVASTYTWTYDRYGNRLSQSFNGNGLASQTSGWSFDPVTNHLQVQGGNVQYDAAGNMMVDQAGNHHYYDAEGNLTQSNDANGTLLSANRYNAINERVQEVSPSSNLLYTFNPWGQRTGVYDGAEVFQREQVYWGGKPEAYVMQGSTPVIRYQFQSYNGSERAEDSGWGGAVSLYTWSPWGDDQVTTAGTDEDQSHYATLDKDTDGTHHAQFRNYNSTTAQWMSPDPYSGSYDISDPQSMNRYAYAGNSPLSFIDPSGLAQFFSGNCLYHTDQYADPIVGEGGVYVLRVYEVPVLDVCYGGAGGSGASAGGGVVGPRPGGGAPSNFQLASYNPLNPCSNANAGALDYNVNNAQNHILNNHVHIGKPKSVYAGDWTGIQALNASTLSFGTLAPPSFQRPGTYALQWDAPQPFSWMGISNYIGFTQAGDLTTRNLLVVQSNCKSVVTSYPIPD